MIRPLFCAAGLLSCAFSFAFPLSAQTVPVGLQFTSLGTPCRAVDTRLTGGPIAAGTFQSFNPGGGACAQNDLGPFPQGTIAWAMNVTVVPHGSLGYMSIWPTGEPQPIVSTLNSPDGRVKANAAIVSGGNGQEVSVYVTDLADVVIDVTGYFSPSELYGEQELFIPTTPCRLVDTRTTMPLQAGAAQSFEPSSPCFTYTSGGQPYTEAGPGTSLSLNVTAVPAPGHGVGYLTMWGGDDTIDVPVASTLNDPTGTVVANAAILGPQANGSPGGNLNAYASDTTDLVVDANGFFQFNQTVVSGMALYPVSPCRVLDTRQSGGAFQGPINVPFTTSPCKLPVAAKAYVVNATVVPSPQLNYLTLWPDDRSSQPLVSTLNASDGFTASNMAIIGTSAGSINAYATNPTNLIFDVTGYFAPLLDTSGLKVAFMGDDTVQTAVAAVQAQHPNWINAGGRVGEITNKMLARFQTDVLDKHPDVVVIEAGQYDMVQPGYDLQPYGGCGSGTNDMCQNVGTMFDMAYKAGVKYLIHSFLNCGQACATMAGANAENVEIAMDEYNRLMLLGEGQGDPPHPVVLITPDLVGGSITILDGFADGGTDPALAHARARQVRAAR